jgi:hypothetical protein
MDPESSNTKDELVRKMRSAISQKSSSTAETYNFNEYLLMNLLNKEINPTPKMLYHDTKSVDEFNEDVDLARFQANDMFETHNPYKNLKSEDVLSRITVDNEKDHMNNMFVKVTYGSDPKSGIYWKINRVKDDGSEITCEELTSRFFEIIYFAPALHEHLYRWYALGIALSTDFIEEEGKRKFTMGIFQIGDKKVCKLEKMGC